MNLTQIASVIFTIGFVAMLAHALWTGKTIQSPFYQLWDYSNFWVQKSQSPIRYWLMVALIAAFAAWLAWVTVSMPISN